MASGDNTIFYSIADLTIDLGTRHRFCPSPSCPSQRSGNDSRCRTETFWGRCQVVSNSTSVLLVHGRTKVSRSDHRKTLQLGTELQHASTAATRPLELGSPLDHRHWDKIIGRPKLRAGGALFFFGSLKSNSPNIPDCGVERRHGVALHDAARLLSLMSQQFGRHLLISILWPGPEGNTRAHAGRTQGS